MTPRSRTTTIGGDNGKIATGIVGIMPAVALLALLLAVQPAFADVGPAPPAPDVTVHLVANGAPEYSVQNVTYHCLGSTLTNVSNAVEPYPVDLQCVAGTCTNEGAWYYKFNPCYNFPAGYFSYVYKGGEVRTATVNISGDYGAYDITVDAPTGQVVGSGGSQGSACGLAVFILPAILLGAAILGGKCPRHAK